VAARSEGGGAQGPQSLAGPGHRPGLFAVTACGLVALFHCPLRCAVRSSSSHDPAAVAACCPTAWGRSGPRCARPVALPAADRCEEGRDPACRDRARVTEHDAGPM